METRTVPGVSVVMPAYNAGRYLAEAIDSILSQTYADFELIIVNDGSTDDTQEIIASYADPRIVYLENERNSGICVTLNKGIDAARGRYIARMDADDVMMPERLEAQVAYMDAHPEVGALGSDIEVFGEGVDTHLFTQLHTPDECAAGLLFNSCFAHPSVMIRKSVLTDNGLSYKEEFRGLEDYELWWQIGKHSLLNNLARPLLRYRQHREQATQNVSPAVRAAFERFVGIRFDDLGLKVSDTDRRLWLAYTRNDFEQFGPAEFTAFIDLSRRVLRHYRHAGRAMRRAVRLTLSKGITYIVLNSSRLADHRQRFFNRALTAGVFPLGWFAKVTLHNLLR